MGQNVTVKNNKLPPVFNVGQKIIVISVDYNNLVTVQHNVDNIVLILIIK